MAGRALALALMVSFIYNNLDSYSYIERLEKAPRNKRKHVFCHTPCLPKEPRDGLDATDRRPGGGVRILAT